MGVWENSEEFRLPGLPKQPESAVVARGQVLPRRSATHQLPHMSVWKPDKQVLQPGTSTAGALPRLNSVPNNV